MAELKDTLPIYHQIKQIIREKILTNELKPDDRIPSEIEMAKLYGVSRMTVRNALNELVMEGYLYRVPGKGTFVARPRIERSFALLTGFMEDMRQKGLRPSSKLLSLKQIIPDSVLRKRLKLLPNEKVFEIVRLRYANEEPIVIQASYIPVFFCPGIESENLEISSLYDILEAKYQLVLDHAQQRLEATVADEKKAQLLGIKIGAPLLYIYRLSFLANGTPVEFVESWYRSDRYAFEVMLYKNLNLR
ncbi:MAG: GntR family transcriptional regulator [Thermoanaerobacter sp.]|nr:GntR family transcriptional regulator [Thermoanaerobacter sp.]